MSTLLWTLALLLLTNVFWSVWAASGMNHPDGPHFNLTWEAAGGTELPGQRLLVVLADGTATREVYTVWIEQPDPNTGESKSAGPWSAEELMPSWLQFYCGSNGVLRDDEQFDFCATESVGWPLHMLWVGSWSSASVVKPVPWSGVRIFESTKSDAAKLDGMLPLRPIWNGQLLYGAFWLFIVCTARSIPRLRRRRKGHCPHCNYNLHANTTGTCPECGATVRAAAST